MRRFSFCPPLPPLSHPSPPHPAHVQIWDTAGQERFRTITTSYFRGAQGILLVFDVTDKGSFQSIVTWLQEIQKNADSHVNKILIGNKCDVDESQRNVTRAEGEELARKHGMMYFETSAKKDLCVSEAFQYIAGQVVERLSKDRPRPKELELKLDPNVEKKKGCPCGGS